MAKKNQKWIDVWECWECMERWVTGFGKDDKGPTKEEGMCFGGAREGCLLDYVESFQLFVGKFSRLGYLFSLLNRQNLKHELFAFPSPCCNLLL